MSKLCIFIILFECEFSSRVLEILWGCQRCNGNTSPEYPLSIIFNVNEDKTFLLVMWGTFQINSEKPLQNHKVINTWTSSTEFVLNYCLTSEGISNLTVVVQNHHENIQTEWLDLNRGGREGRIAPFWICDSLPSYGASEIGLTQMDCIAHEWHGPHHIRHVIYCQRKLKPKTRWMACDHVWQDIN